MPPLTILPIKNIPILKFGDNIPDYLLKCVNKDDDISGFKNGDILIISHTIICRAMGYLKNINEVEPGKIAKILADGSDLYGKLKNKIDPRVVQLILDHSNEIVRPFPHLITESENGLICAHSGIDKSNVEGSENYVFLPSSADEIAKSFRFYIKQKTGIDVCVIITDSQGRPFRIGTIGVTVGISGLNPVADLRGRKDLFGYELSHKIVNIGDELCSTAQLVMGESDEAIPAAIIRNFSYKFYNLEFPSKEDFSAKTCVRPKETDIFRGPDALDLLRSRNSFKGTYLDKEVPRDVVLKALSLIKYAPSSKNRQPWQYIWVKSMEVRNKILKRIGLKMTEKYTKDNCSPDYIREKTNSIRAKLTAAPLFFIICLDESAIINKFNPKRGQKEKILLTQSVASSITYLLLALKYYDIDSCWDSTALYCTNTIKRTLDLPEYLSPQAIVMGGYSEKKIGEKFFPERPERKKISKLLKIL